MSSELEGNEFSKDESQFSVNLKTNKIKKKNKNKKKTKKNSLKFLTSTYKKQKCLHFNKGNCTKGQLCTFSHDFLPQCSKIICKYYLSNGCSKADKCFFSHNLKDYPCKFFHLQSRCSQLNECRFSHQIINKDYLNDFIKENKQLILTLWRQNKLYLVSDENLKSQIILLITNESFTEQQKKKEFKSEIKLLAQNSVQLAEQTIKSKVFEPSFPADPRLKMKLVNRIKVQEDQKIQKTQFSRDWIIQIRQNASQKIKLSKKTFGIEQIQKFLYSYY